MPMPIAYIPTILAYVFVGLLICILGFIVLYVSHKIYGYVYDNMPVVQLKPDPNDNHYGDTTMKRKPKPALRIYVHMGTCHLAYAVFESTVSQHLNRNQQPKIIKYYDSLTSIPKDLSSTPCTEV